MARNREFNTEEVLDKAIELFWNKGFNGVSTQELIDKFGISKSSMYGAFGDKIKLFIVSLERYHLQVLDHLEDRLSNCINVRNEIKEILTDVCKIKLEEGKDKGCFIVNSCIELASHNDEIASIMREHRKRLENAFVTAIKRAIQQGDISNTKNPVAISRMICNTISGIKVDTKYIKDETYFNDIINTVIEPLY
jgi:TetR/AcrR family transcriptional repressor of nem operon